MKVVLKRNNMQPDLTTLLLIFVVICGFLYSKYSSDKEVKKGKNFFDQFHSMEAYVGLTLIGVFVVIAIVERLLNNSYS
jgi:hypothetical protein